MTLSQCVDIPYGWKFWRGIYFGGLAVLRAICQYFHPPKYLQCDVIVTRRHQYVVHRFKMSARKLQTSKEWNENSPDLIYLQLVPALFDVLWLKTDPAVFTLLTFPVCYICHHFAMNIIMVSGLPNRQSKIRQMPLLEQSAKYSSRQNFRLYGTSAYLMTYCMYYLTYKASPSGYQQRSIRIVKTISGDF